VAGALVLSSGEVVARDVLWARGRLTRAKGLIGRPPLEPGQALVLSGGGCQVHTFGMSYPLDVVFCNAEWKVVHLIRCLRRRRLTRWVGGCRYVIEMRADALPRGVQVGVQLIYLDA
jgi:uncharacterized membrane protein (UPF0127 family)